MRSITETGILNQRPVHCGSSRRFISLSRLQDHHLRCLPTCQIARNFKGTRFRYKYPLKATSFRLYSSSTSSSRYSFRVGAAFSAKNTRFNSKTDLFSFDATKDDEAVFTGKPRSGQDAFFVSKIESHSNVAFGVADGVGGWIDSGIDSAHFSHGLCRYMAKSARESRNSEKKLKPVELLQEGYESVVADRSIAGGGSTACVAIARDNGNVEVANLGDSGFVQLRLNGVHHYSNPQTHAFNTPYQLSVIPPRILARSRIFGGKPKMDYPRDASITSHDVRNGDVLVFATDGVWDNLSSLDLLKVVSRQMQVAGAWETGPAGVSVSDTLDNLTRGTGESTLQSLVATKITGEAKFASLNTNADGPFARQVQRFYPHEDFHGGKVDDICVIAAIVVKDSRG